MTNIINFKNWDQELFEEEYEDNFDDFEDDMIAMAQEDGSSLYDLYDSCKQWIILKIIKNEASHEELTRYFRYAMQSLYGHIVTLEHLGEEQEIWVADKKVHIKKETSVSYKSVDTLIDFLNITAICRCKEALEAIFRQDGTGPFLDNPNAVKSYYYDYYFLERSLDKVDNAIIQRELEIGNQKAEKFYKNDAEFKEWYPAIYIPLSELKHEFFLGDEASFNEKLQIALNKNRSYYDDPKGRYANLENWIPWELIAFACRAYDKGWNITVEDSRLPKFLIEGKCNVGSLAP
ncbi:MAG: immunity 49 family protein [Bacteroidota bacterium]